MRQLCLHDATEEMDMQLVQLEKARAILSKVSESLELKVEPDTTDAYLLIADMGRLHLLLCTADELLHRVIPELKTISNDVLKIHNKHKRDREELNKKVRSCLEHAD